MDMNEAWPVAYNEGLHKLQPALTHKNWCQQQEHRVETYPLVEHLLDDHENHQYENNHKLCDEERYPILSLKES